MKYYNSCVTNVRNWIKHCKKKIILVKKSFPRSPEISRKLKKCQNRSLIAVHLLNYLLVNCKKIQQIFIKWRVKWPKYSYFCMKSFYQKEWQNLPLFYHLLVPPGFDSLCITEHHVVSILYTHISWRTVDGCWTGRSSWWCHWGAHEWWFIQTVCTSYWTTVGYEGISVCW